MISPNQISRMVRSGASRQLVGRILANGRCEIPAAARRLQDPDSATLAALGLALQRVCELTYRPDALGHRLADRLLGLQRADGRFELPPSRTYDPPPAAADASPSRPTRGANDHRSHRGHKSHGASIGASIEAPSGAPIGASAVAVRGLLAWDAHCRESGVRVDSCVTRAIASGLRALADALGREGLEQASGHDTAGTEGAEDAKGAEGAEDAAIVVWQLGRGRVLALRQVVGAEIVATRANTLAKPIKRPFAHELRHEAAA